MSVIQRNNERDPLLLGVVFFAFLFAIIGAILGFVLLAFIPLKSFGTVEELNKFAENNPQTSLLDGYWFEGPVDVSPDLIQKRDRFLKGDDSAVELSDGEINAWVTAEFSKTRSTFSLKDRPGVLILPELPNFFINDFVGFTFSIPIEIIIYGNEHNNLMIVQGNFIEDLESSTTKFQVETLRFNDARIPLSKEWNRRLLVNLLQPYLKTDEFINFMKASEEVDSVELVESRIRLNLD